MSVEIDGSTTVSTQELVGRGGYPNEVERLVFQDVELNIGDSAVVWQPLEDIDSPNLPHGIGDRRLTTANFSPRNFEGRKVYYDAFFDAPYDKRWIGLSYGIDARAIDPTRPSRVIVNQASLEDAIRIQGRIRDEILVDEKSRIAQTHFLRAETMNKYISEQDLSSVNIHDLTDLWLFTLMEGWPIFLPFDPDNLGWEADTNMVSHDKSAVHNGNAVYLPREAQDILTDAILYSVEDRREFRAGRATQAFLKLAGDSTVEGKLSLDGQLVPLGFDGPYLLDRATDISNYLNLLALLVASDDVDEMFEIAHDRTKVLNYFIDQGHNKIRTPRLREQASQPVNGLRNLRLTFTRIIVFNYRHENGSNPNADYIFEELNKIYLGVKRVARKIRGEQIPPYEDDSLLVE